MTTTKNTEAHAEFARILAAFDSKRAARDTQRAMWLRDLYDVQRGVEPMTVGQRRRKSDRLLLDQERDARWTTSVAAELALKFNQQRMRDGFQFAEAA